jgi:hypothetical protein
MYVYSNTETRSRDDCCRAKAISIKCYKHVFVALLIQQAKSMRRTILSPMTRLAPPYFFHIISKTTRFSKKKNIEEKRVLNIFTNLTWIISRFKNNFDRYCHKCTFVFT